MLYLCYNVKKSKTYFKKDIKTLSMMSGNKQWFCAFSNCVNIHEDGYTHPRQATQSVTCEQAEN